jgi:hypothetical protein
VSGPDLDVNEPMSSNAPPSMTTIAIPTISHLTQDCFLGGGDVVPVKTDSCCASAGGSCTGAGARKVIVIFPIVIVSPAERRRGDSGSMALPLTRVPLLLPRSVIEA